MKFQFIGAHAREFAVTTMCRVLEVSKAGYYAWVSRAPSARTVADQGLVETIRTVHERSRRTYGSPRVHRDLHEAGVRVSEKRVARAMRVHGIRAKAPRRFRVTTDAAHAHPIAPNVLERQFAVDAIPGVNRRWVADITYIDTREGWLYLAVVLDLASRRVVGWSMQHRLEQALVLDALRMALATRGPVGALVHHSDRGAQYASAAYRTLLAAHDITCSMSRTGNCWDNAVAESFFATLKRELGHDVDWPTREAARAALFEYIEVWYNRARRHSALGYVSPAAYEAQLQAA